MNRRSLGNKYELEMPQPKARNTPSCRTTGGYHLLWKCKG